MGYGRGDEDTQGHHLIDTIIINNTEVNYDASKAHFLLRLKARR